MNNELIKQTESILEEKDKLASLCNVIALLYEQTRDINWLGLYLYKNKELVLGPFQGKVACTHIPIGRGVCGTAYEKKQLLNVDNVHNFTGHIACDSASNSELVVPLLLDNKIYGVLDIDSPLLDRFTYEDEETFTAVAHLISKKLTE
ncbi:MAG: GAF domain-containing protein [Erysipelotrichaceae bacterium]|nr:GAF domain-containing protein [Erysipelotrichaceae bacterium]